MQASKIMRIEILEDEDDWVSSDRVDPLQSYTCLSNLKLSMEPSNPDYDFDSELQAISTNPDYDFDRELQAISTNLKSMAKPHGHIDQVVKNILSGSSEVENCNISQALKDKHVYVSANKVENREPRADLGRKRARFSMKPDSSQPSVRLEPTFNTKKHKDPEEYFKAYERNENARREIAKQMGVALASDQQNPSSFTRPRRRQGLKRESVKTKHLFSSVTNEFGENPISSQETLEPSIPFNQSSQTKSDKISLMEEMDLTGYKSDDFLDELLSLPTEDLEGDGAECLLRERLQIKSFQPEDCLPEFLDFTLINLKSSKRTLPKPRPLKTRQGAEESLVENRSKKYDLIDISEKKRTFDDLLSFEQNDNFEGEVGFEDFTIAFERSKRENSITPGVGCDVDNKEEIGDSRVMSKMLSSVNADSMVEGIQQEAESEYNATGISFEKLSGTHSQVAHGIMGSDEIQEDNQQQTMPEPNVDKLNDVSIQADIEINNDKVNEQDELQQNAVEKSNDAPSQSGMIVQEQDAVEKSNDTPSQSDQSHSASVEEHLRDGLSRNSEINPDRNNETTEEPVVPLNEHTKAKSPPRKKQKSKENSRRQSLTDQGTSWESVVNSADKTVEQSYNAPSQSDQSHSASVDERLRDGLSRNPEISTDWHNETTEEPGVPLNEPTKANSPPHRKQKGKKNSRRQSLADQGTSWETGVRRSTRFRTRPLEFWRGERLLYARIHKSLPTVIGMKYSSPGKGEGGALKVKSFVDDKYKDLVELASLH